VLKVTLISSLSAVMFKMGVVLRTAALNLKVYGSGSLDGTDGTQGGSGGVICAGKATEVTVCGDNAPPS